MISLKERLFAGDYVTAAWLGSGSPDVAEMLVRTGWPVIVIDGEHGIGDLEDWVSIARAAEAAGGEVVLRVPDGTDTTLKRVLDRGFRALMVPMVNTPEQAQAIAQSCLYPPQGRRGYAAPVLRASGYGTRPAYALEGANRDLLLMVQCEHHVAVENLAAIAAVPGIDMIFVGPNDLAGSVGLLERLEDPKVRDLLARIEATAEACDARLGTITGAGRGWAELRRRGYGLAVGPSDVSLLLGALRGAAADRDAALILRPGI